MDIKNKKKNLTKDELLVDYIKDQLEEKMEASSMDINVTARDGSVHLSGFVDILSEKKYAEEVTRNINGVKKVENNITIGMDSNITDKHIEKEVIDQLRSSGHDERVLGVGAQVHDGVASLVGHVDTLKDAHLAMEAASKARGVKDVVNNINIKTSGEKDDVRINNRIHQELKTNEEISGSDIVCDVNHGIVTLQGYVNSKSQVELAKEIVMGIEGVKKVKTMIKPRE